MDPERERLIDLHAEYAGESPLVRYRRLVCGEHGSWMDLVWHELVLMVLPLLPGGAGIALRALIYPLLFPGMNRKAFVGSNVLLRNPRGVRLGRQVLIDDGVQFWANSRCSPSIALGNNVFVRSGASFNAGPPEGYIRIGDGSSIGQFVVIYGTGGVEIGENVMVAAHSSIIASSHVMDASSTPMSRQGVTAKGIRIGNNVWIGAGVRVLDGVTIGDGAVVGANAVVNRDVMPGQRVGGVPARLLRSSL